MVAPPQGLSWIWVRFLQDLAIDLTRHLARDRDLYRDRNQALDSNRARDLDFNRDLDRDRALALNLDADFDLDPALALDLALDRDSNLYRDFALYHAFDRDLTFDRAFDPDIYRDLYHAFDRDLDLERAFEGDLVLSHCLRSSFLQEAFFPNLSESLPLLNLFSLRGAMGDALLEGPGLVAFDLESDGRTVHPVDLEGTRPASLARRGYDLVFPMTAIPLGTLRKNCSAWRSDRRLRPLGVAPFLLPEAQEVWLKYADFLRQLFRVDRLFALLPRIELWSKPFADWTDDDWQTCGYSALWDVTTGRVLWAKGARDVAEMPEVGKPFDEFFGLSENENV